jgi:hypothetical protein
VQDEFEANAAASLGPVLERFSASRGAVLAWSLLGALLVGFALALAMVVLPSPAAAPYVVCGFVFALGAVKLAWVLRYQRGARIALHADGFTFSSGPRRLCVPAGSFTVLSNVSMYGLAPTLYLALERSRLRIYTHWFADGRRLSEELCAFESVARVPPADVPSLHALAKHAWRQRVQIAVGILFGAICLVRGGCDFASLRALESGASTRAEVWAPVADLHEQLGIEVALLPHLVLLIAALASTVHTWKRDQQARQRRLRLSTFPVAVRGSESTKSTSRGTL